ncbi:MAG: PAS domain S-box protein [Cytophagales bacterium]|nr:PAS domain S-box protein [Armatimonadota bacterium]
MIENAFTDREDGQAADAADAAAGKTDGDLRRGAERYRAFAENSAEGIWLFESEQPIPVTAAPDAQIEQMYRHGYLAECNEAMARRYGVADSRPLLGTRLGAFLMQGDPRSEAHLRAFIESGYRLSDAESVERDRDGSLRWFANSLMGIVENGCLLRAWGTQRDITRQKQAEVALRESEARFRRLADASPALIWMTDAEGSGIYFNQAWLKFRGLSLEQQSSIGFSDGVHPDDQDAVRRVSGAAVVLQQAFTTEYRLRRHDGVYRWLLDDAVPLTDKDGAFTGFLGSCIDITERREAAEQHQQSEAQFRLMADAAPVLIWVSDTTAACTYFNKSWLDFTGRTQEQEAGDGWTEGIYPDDRDRSLQVYQTAFAARQPFTMEYRLRRSDGEYRWLLDNGVPYRDDSGLFQGFIGSCIDVTESKKAEAERTALQMQQRRFVREMLSSLTEGRLLLCDTDGDLPRPLATEPIAPPVTLTHRSLNQFRHGVNAACDAAGFGRERCQDLETAVGEASMNSVVHAGGGVGRVYADQAQGLVQVWVSDQGSGIAEESLHRATLERGFTTAGTLGHGFWMILRTIDRIYLLTGPHGTTVVLEQQRTAPSPAWMKEL